eukprot:3729164-Rhodomonas_salina.1
MTRLRDCPRDDPRDHPCDHAADAEQSSTGRVSRRRGGEREKERRRGGKGGRRRGVEGRGGIEEGAQTVMAGELVRGVHWPRCQRDTPH